MPSAEFVEDRDGAPSGSRRIAGLTCADVSDRLPALVDGPVWSARAGHAFSSSLVESPGERPTGRSGRLGSRRADRRVTAHVGQCLRCQAEVASYRRLLRGLHGLRTEMLEPAPGAVAGVLAAVAARGERSAARALLSDHPALYGAGLAMGAAACGAGAALVLVTRRRHR